MSARNKTIVQNIYNAFGRGDIEQVFAQFDENVVWSYPGNPPYIKGGPFVGCADVAENVLAPLATEWEYFYIEPMEFVAEDDRVVVIARETGKHKISGESVDVMAVHLWRVADGKVLELTVVTDTLQFAKAANVC